MPGLIKEMIDGRKGYRVGEEFFRTKNGVRDRCREALHRSPLLGMPVTSSDLSFLKSLLAFHRRCAEKAGCGIDEIVVVDNPKFPSQRTFWIRRSDGSHTDFSFEQCISPTPPIRDLKSALRAEVEDQVIAVKRALFEKFPEAACPLTGERMTWGENSHVDHEPPRTFDVIAEAFVAEFDLNPETVRLTGSEDGSVSMSLADRELASRWKSFHASRAKLRVISVKANLSLVKRQGKKDE